jgi:SAM-dependent methyltransferase
MVRVAHRMRFALRVGHPLADRYDVVSCNRCGFVYADTPSPQSDYDRYYADLSKYADNTTGTGAGTEVWDRSRLRDTASFVADSIIDTATRVVDIGCANGGLLQEFQSLGFIRLDGVDPSPACVAALEQHSDIRGHLGSLFDLPASVRGADCVILSHVLEHVRDVGAAIDHVADVITASGRVYVETPDATRYASFPTAPFQDFNVEHINHFSPTSLSNVLTRAGFVIERVHRKAINASATTLVPAVGVMAKRSNNRSTWHPLFDTELGPAIAAYIARSREGLAAIQSHLDHELAGVPEVVIWGTGQTTLTLLSSARLHSRVVALTDSSPRYHGRHLGGIPVFAPQELTRFDVPIVIGSLISYQAIENRIRELELPNRTIRLTPY